MAECEAEPLGDGCNAPGGEGRSRISDRLPDAGARPLLCGEGRLATSGIPWRNRAAPQSPWGCSAQRVLHTANGARVNAATIRRWDLVPIGAEPLCRGIGREVARSAEAFHATA